MAEKPKKQNENDEQMTFERALERLEEIAEEMESGRLNLDLMVARFEEGMKLVRFCNAKLNEVRQRIEQLTKEGKVEPFEPPTEAPF